MSKDFREIKSYEDACADQQIDPARLPDVSMLPAGLAKFITAATKLSVIAVSLNKDADGNERKANWNDHRDYKWSAWFDVDADKENPSGSGLSFSGAGYGRSNTRVASRLTCRSEEIAEYFYGSDNFKALWEDYILHRD